jgi:hypothetical protein
VSLLAKDENDVFTISAPVEAKLLSYFVSYASSIAAFCCCTWSRRSGAGTGSKTCPRMARRRSLRQLGGRVAMTSGTLLARFLLPLVCIRGGRGSPGVMISKALLSRSILTIRCAWEREITECESLQQTKMLIQNVVVRYKRNVMEFYLR